MRGFSSSSSSLLSDLNDKVIMTKNSLMNALGDHRQKYLNNMKMWFRNKWSKEEFDIESRKLLNADKIHLHNQFLLAILNKIEAISLPQQQQQYQHQMPGSSSLSSDQFRNNRKRKRNSRFNSERATFEPYDLYDYLIEENFEFIKPPNSSNNGDLPSPQSIPTQRYCVQELFLPDIRFMMGRFLVGAWESGLINVEDQVAEYVCIAVQMLLKNLISAIIMKRKLSRVTGEGTYYYDIGTNIKDPFARNTVTRQKIDDQPIDIHKEITTIGLLKKSYDNDIFLSSCEELYPQRKHLITVRDVYKALQDRNIIGSHMVYSINMERLSQMLH